VPAERVRFIGGGASVSSEIMAHTRGKWWSWRLKAASLQASGAAARRARNDAAAVRACKLRRRRYVRVGSDDGGAGAAW
jgi:hypothetical protein